MRHVTAVGCRWATSSSPPSSCRAGASCACTTRRSSATPRCRQTRRRRARRTTSTRSASTRCPPGRWRRSRRSATWPSWRRPSTSRRPRRCGIRWTRAPALRTRRCGGAHLLHATMHASMHPSVHPSAHPSAHTSVPTPVHMSAHARSSQVWYGTIEREAILLRVKEKAKWQAPAILSGIDEPDEVRAACHTRKALPPEGGAPAPRRAQLMASRFLYCEMDPLRPPLGCNCNRRCSHRAAWTLFPA